MTQRLATAAGELEAWLTRRALPLWATTGFNRSAGLSHERLLPGGTPDPGADLRVRVQARQLFVFSMACHRGWYPEGRANAGAIFESIHRLASQPDAGGGYVHLLNSRLDVVDARQDLYDHACLLLAYLWYYRAFGVPVALERAERLVAHLDERLGSEHGGWREGDYPAEYRRQNPHMHLFEAFLAGYDATGEGHWLDRADAVFALFEKHFYAPDKRVLLEYFNDDWSLAAGDKGRIVEPGHMMEWVGLLRAYEQRRGRLVAACADALYERALAVGLEPASGLLYDQVDVDGNPVSATKRCWPMTELIKAHIAQARAGHSVCEDRAAAAVEALMRYYLDTAVPGTYIDQRGADNAITADMTQGSTLYHLAVAGAEASDYCRKLAG